MNIIPSTEIYADQKLQLSIGEVEPTEHGPPLCRKDYGGVPGLPTADVHFYYLIGLDKTDLKKERCGKQHSAV